MKLQLAKAADDYLKIATELDPGEQATTSENTFLYFSRAVSIELYIDSSIKFLNVTKYTNTSRGGTSKPPRTINFTPRTIHNAKIDEICCATEILPQYLCFSIMCGVVLWCLCTVIAAFGNILEIWTFSSAIVIAHLFQWVYS